MMTTRTICSTTLSTTTTTPNVTEQHNEADNRTATITNAQAPPPTTTTTVKRKNTSHAVMQVRCIYVPWCKFLTRLAPMYNSLPRAFAQIDILAFDVSTSIEYNTKFCTSAVPIILLFQNRNMIAKILADFFDFVEKNTGLEGYKSVTVSDTDLVGPVLTMPVKGFDFFLFFSWMFRIVFSADMLVRRTHLQSHIVNAGLLVIHLASDLFKRHHILELPQPPQFSML